MEIDVARLPNEDLLHNYVDCCESLRLSELVNTSRLMLQRIPQDFISTWITNRNIYQAEILKRMGVK
jgi:hypothetical protein